MGQYISYITNCKPNVEDEISYHPHHNQSWERGRSNMSHGNPHRNQTYSSTNQPSNHNWMEGFSRWTQDKQRATQSNADDDKGYQYSETNAPYPNPHKNHCFTPNPGHPQFNQGNYNPHHNQSWERGRSNMSHGNPHRNQTYSSTNQPSTHDWKGEYSRRTQDKPRSTQVHSTRSDYTDSRHRINRSVSSNEPPVMLLTEDYFTNNGLQITCYVGVVTRADAEGIVIGEGYGMTEPSMVTKSLCDLACISYDELGQIVTSMCGTTNLTCGEVYSLDTNKYGIDLDFTHVFLAVVLRFRHDNNPLEWHCHMVELYTNIFDEAEAHGVKSIAVPLLGSSRAGAPPCLAAMALVRSLSKQTANRLQKVLLVSFDQDTHIEIVEQWKEYFAEESEVETRKVLANFVAEMTHAHNQKKSKYYGNTVTDHNGKNCTEKDNQSKPSGHAYSNSNHSSATETPALLKKMHQLKKEHECKIQQLKKQTECKICLDAAISIIFLPCGHLACCEPCAAGVSECPICRKAINKKKPVYWT